jgi:hypothetical protein
MKRLRKRNEAEEHLTAVELARRSIRRGNLREAKEWFAIADRCMRYERQVANYIMEDEKQQAWRAERPHRLKALEHRSRFTR